MKQRIKSTVFEASRFQEMFKNKHLDRAHCDELNSGSSSSSDINDFKQKFDELKELYKNAQDYDARKRIADRIKESLSTRFF